MMRVGVVKKSTSYETIVRGRSNGSIISILINSITVSAMIFIYICCSPLRCTRASACGMAQWLTFFQQMAPFDGTTKELHST